MAPITTMMTSLVTMMIIMMGLLSQQTYLLPRINKLNVPIAYFLVISTFIEISSLNDGNQDFLLDATSCSPQVFRIDCHPDSNPNRDGCEARGCCWQEEEETNKSGESQAKYPEAPFIGNPKCFFPSDYDCYDIKSIELEDERQPAEEHLAKDNAVKSEQQNNVSNNNDHDNNNNNKNEDGKLVVEQQQQTLLQRQQQSFGSFRLIRTRKQSCAKLSGFTDEASLIEVEITVHGDSLVNIKITQPGKVRSTSQLPEIKLPNKTKFQKTGYYFDEEGKKWLRINSLLVGLVKPKQHGYKDDTSSPTSSLSSRLPDSLPRSVLKIIHPASGVVLFETDLAKMIYSKQFIQFPTILPSSYVYGLGLNQEESLLKTSENHYAKIYTLFNYGHPPNPKTSYSSYPFYINLAQLNYGDDDENSHINSNLNPNSDSNRLNFEWKRRIMATGGLMLNSNAMDILLHSNINTSQNDFNFNSNSSNDSKNDKNQCNSRAAITWRLTGGIVDLYLFVGPTPHEVIRQYQDLVGAPGLMPAWALGYHQSRLNYRDLMEIKLAWARTRSAGIPIDSVGLDIDWLWKGNSYSVNNPELNQLVTTFQNDFDMHFVTIVDPAISVGEEMSCYEPFKLAKSFDLFATYSKNDTSGGSSSSSSVLNGESQLAIVTNWAESKRSALIDFTHPHVVDYLRQILSHYKQQLNFDGLWLDMNEPEVFANHPVGDRNGDNGSICPYDESLPYLPRNLPNLNDRTLCMSANFHAGKHADIHNLYAFYQSKAHFEALKALNQSRPFILSRSQFSGQARYSGTWLGDLDSSYQHLRWSLLGIIESNFFGQPFIGGDICGFFGDTSDELCSRWFSLGAFYPLSRNHNDGHSKTQDPGSLGEVVQRAARIALLRRYAMLPYLYSLFYENHLKTKPVVRSILFEFFDKFFLTSNLKDLPQIDDQFMWGSAIMIAPILDENAQSRSVYFPPGRWYDLSIGLPGTNMKEGPYNALISNWPQVYLHKRVVNLRKMIKCEDEKGCFMDQFTPVGAVNIYLRAGQIIPTFYEFGHETSIKSLWLNASFFLEIGLDENQSALGSLYWDNGNSEPEAMQYNYADFWVSKNRLVISALEERSSSKIRINGFIVYGVEETRNFTESVIYNNVLLKYNYSGDTKILTCLFVSPLDGKELSPLSMRRFDTLIFTW